MGRATLIICACPDLQVDPQALAHQLGRTGVEVRLAPPLCTPKGLIELRALLREGDREWLVAACGPERHAGFFQLQAGTPLQVVDLLGCGDLEEALGLLNLARAAPAVTPVDAPLSRDILVIGGGVGGCQAALDLAQAGFKVYLADSSLSIGGTMAQLDKTFPTLDCAICILGPKLVEVATHPRIELLTYAEVDHITGQAGQFQVDLTLKPRYVDMSKCVGCGTCAEVCPVIIPSRWNLGLKPRKCIRIIFAQAVPLRATIEMDYCIDCRMCVQACDRQAINLEDAPQARRLTVGAIILATGAKPFDPAIKSEYGYGRIPTVVTSLEYERLICATGPTQGSLVTPEGRPVHRVAFIQCVGSRDRRFLPYCSGFCCTASIKQAMLVLEQQPDAAVTIFYNDIRTSGKGFEELYRRARRAGVRFIKGLPGRIREDGAGRPVIYYEDQETGKLARLCVDLAVLAVGLEAPAALLPFADSPPGRDAWGFYQGRHPVLHPLESTKPGVFLAGTCQGPRDISETVCQGSAVAARVIRLLGAMGSGGGG
ncbi:MAG: CoB--CoM heterodisulfide reductase iron-sulfur subunit A family protein [Thermodesulfobacteriota bacterium]